MGKLLEIVNLEKRFELHILNEKEIHALHEVSFEVGEGEVVGLTGKTGSGKSTLMRCIYRTYLASRGQILYHHKDRSIVDLATSSEHEVLRIRKTEMTYCSQFLQVIPRVPAIDVVASALSGRGMASANEARRMAGEYFERLTLPHELWDAYPATFSGGEQQRVNIARAMISGPRILLRRRAHRLARCQNQRCGDRYAARSQARRHLDHPHHPRRAHTDPDDRPFPASGERPSQRSGLRLRGSMKRSGVRSSFSLCCVASR